jgi:hypothetical protein
MADLSYLERCTDGEFFVHFQTFRREAFRYEGRQIYAISTEDEDFSAFMRGENYDHPTEETLEWCEEVKAGSAQGKRYIRVREIVRPLSDYTRFEIATGYRFFIEAGENIRVIFRDQATERAEQFEDFWLFDDSLCVVLQYAEDGSFLSTWRVKPESIEKFVRLKRKLLGASLHIRETPLLEDV